jgi:hypothetical protein
MMPVEQAGAQRLANPDCSDCQNKVLESEMFFTDFVRAIRKGQTKPSCDDTQALLHRLPWNNPTRENASLLCTHYRAAILTYFKECEQGRQMLAGKTREGAILRIQASKLLFAAELERLLMIPPGTAGYWERWGEFKAKWQKRVVDAKDDLAKHDSVSLPEQGRLPLQYLVSELDRVRFQREQSFRSFESQSGYPVRLGRTFLHLGTVVNVLNRIEKDRRYRDMASMAPLLKNEIYRQYPELLLDPTILRLASGYVGTLDQSMAVEKITQSFAEHVRSAPSARSGCFHGSTRETSNGSNASFWRFSAARSSSWIKSPRSSRISAPSRRRSSSRIPC